MKLHLAGEEVEAVVDTGATASLVGKCLIHKLGSWKRVRKGKVRQRDGSLLEGNYVVSTVFKVMDSFLVVDTFGMHAEVSDIGNADIILTLSRFTENGFLVDT